MGISLSSLEAGKGEWPNALESRNNPQFAIMAISSGVSCQKFRFLDKQRQIMSPISLSFSFAPPYILTIRTGNTNMKLTGNETDMKLTAPQIKRLCQVAETGHTRGPQAPFRRIKELNLIEPVPMTGDGIILYRLTEEGRKALASVGYKAPTEAQVWLTARRSLEAELMAYGMPLKVITETNRDRLDAMNFRLYQFRLTGE